MNLYSLFLKNFSKDKKIVFNNEVLTYKDFRDEIDLILRNNLIKNKNKIAIILVIKNIYQLYFCMLL